MIKYNSHGDGASDLIESPDEMESLPLDDPSPPRQPPPIVDSLRRNPNPSDFVRVWVSEPRREHDQPGRTAFYTYLITTSTDVAEFGGSEFCVRRRFRDVVALSERLSETKRGFFVPVRPEKGVAVQSEEFLERRRAELEKYLNRLARHPAIRRSDELRAFLGAESGESPPAEAEGRGGRSELVRALKEMRQLEANDWGRVKPLVVEGDKGFLEKKEWLSEFENRLCNLSQQAESLVKAQQDMGETMSDLGLAFVKLSTFETEEAVFDSQRIRASYMKNLAAAAGKSGRLYQELNKQTVKHLDILHDYLGVVFAANNAFSDRSSALLAVQSLSSELSSLNSKIEKLEAASSKIFGGDRSRMRKIDELKETVRLTEAAKSCAIKEYEQIKENNRSELERFDKERQNDFMSMLRGFVLNEVQYAEKMANVWEVLADESSGYIRNWS